MAGLIAPELSLVLLDIQDVGSVIKELIVLSIWLDVRLEALRLHGVFPTLSEGFSLGEASVVSVLLCCGGTKQESENFCVHSN